MKKWMVLPCVLLLAAMLAAQTSAPVPAGTVLMVRLDTTLATFSNRVGDPFQGKIVQPIVLNGKTVIEVNGQKVTVQVGLNMTIVGSKELPK